MLGYRFGNKANFGDNTILSGSYQYVFGSGNTNVADYSVVGGIACGNATTAEHSFVWGSGNLVSGANSAVFGEGNIISGGGFANADHHLLAGRSNNLKSNCDYNIMGGSGNTGGGTGGLTWGAGNTHDGSAVGVGHHAVGGRDNTLAAGYYGLLFGQANVSAAEFGFGLQMGYSGTSQDTLFGAISTAAGNFGTKGDSQLTTNVVYRGQTTNNTATVIYNGATSSNAWDLAANDSVLVKATVIGRKAGDAGQTAAYEVIATFKNQGGTSTIGTTGVTKRVLNEDTGTSNYDATLAENNTADTWELKVTGDTGHNVNWMANVEILKLNVA